MAQFLSVTKPDWSGSLNWHPLLSDFIILGQKLEQLGFTYYKGNVTAIDPAEVPTERVK